MATPHQPTAQEAAHVRRALRYLHARLGTWIAVARAVRVKRRTIRRLRDGGRVKRYAAQKVARLVAVSLDDLLAGKYPAPGTCPHCGMAAQ